MAAGEAFGLPYGIAVGDVTATSAVLWAGPGGPGEVRFEVSAAVDEAGTGGAAASFPWEQEVVRSTDPDADDTAVARVDLPLPGALYRLDVRFRGDDGTELRETGSFHTPPLASKPIPVSFLVGGDVGGQSVCRHRDHGYRIFAAMAERRADFFVGNGDMIYADAECPEEGPDGWPNVPGDFPSVTDPAVDWTDRQALAGVFYAHWRYNRADRHLRRFLESTPIYVQWDDHELVNDSGHAWPEWPVDRERPGWRNLVELARGSFLAYHPLAARIVSGESSEEPRLYRSYRWGREVELWMLDGRSYRSANRLPDTPENAKTLLGREQLDWLVSGLTSSTATWKIVSSNVPWSIPTGYPPEGGRDSFADGPPRGPGAGTGFERELWSLLRELDAAAVEGLVVVATDVHFAMSLRHSVDPDGDGRPLVFYELLSGPLNAGMGDLVEPDETLEPEVLYRETGAFNFQEVRVTLKEGGGSGLVAEVRDETGAVRPGSRLELSR